LLKLKQFVQVLPLLSILGLSGCISSGVSNLFITGVKLTPANPTIAVSATQQFALTATYLDGQTSNVTTSDTTYASDNKAVATVSASGLATAVAIGTANISASYHGNNTKTLLTVSARVWPRPRYLCFRNMVRAGWRSIPLAVTYMW
jgi:hypothetical protein